jgi:hypothetical protein
MTEGTRSEAGPMHCAALGLIQGAVDQLQRPAFTIGIEPFVRADVCLVHTSPMVDGSGERA